MALNERFFEIRMLPTWDLYLSELLVWLCIIFFESFVFLRTFPPSLVEALPLVILFS